VPKAPEHGSGVFLPVNINERQLEEGTAGQPSSDDSRYYYFRTNNRLIQVSHQAVYTVTNTKEKRRSADSVLAL